MKRFILIMLLFYAVTSCKYKEPKATYMLIDTDTIAIDNVLLENAQHHESAKLDLSLSKN